MENCLKSLRKIPMAMLGAIDLSVCGAMWVVNHLAKRGEAVAQKMEVCTCTPKCDCAHSNSSYENETSDEDICDCMP